MIIIAGKWLELNFDISKIFDEIDGLEVTEYEIIMPLLGNLKHLFFGRKVLAAVKLNEMLGTDEMLSIWNLFRKAYTRYKYYQLLQ